jgi:hypothetical protein
MRRRRTGRAAGVADDEDLTVLKATYDRICNERDRLRSARGFFSRPLGAAQASAGLSATVVSTFKPGVDEGLLWAAVGTLLLLVLVGIAYDGKPAYRHLYARELARKRTGRRGRDLWHERSTIAEEAAARAHADDRLRPEEWYREMIRRERAVMGRPAAFNCHYLPWSRVCTMQQGVDLERTGLRVVQALWVVIILLLVLAVLY